MDASAIVIAICKVLCHAPADEHFLDEDPRFSSVPSSFFFRVCLCWVGTAAWVTVVEPAVGKRPAILYQNDDNESVVVSLVNSLETLLPLHPPACIRTSTSAQVARAANRCSPRHSIPKQASRFCVLVRTPNCYAVRSTVTVRGPLGH